MIVVSRRPDRLHEEAPETLSKSVSLYAADVTTCDDLPEADLVIHAAASTDASRYQNDPEVEIRNIEAGAENFCRIAKRRWRNGKILFVSSGAVYGKQPANIEAISEDFPVGDFQGLDAAKSVYGRAKLVAEDRIRGLGRMGLRVGIARCFAFVGPRLPLDQHFAIGNFIADVLAKRRITVRAVFPVFRSYMYSDDLVEWLLTMVDHASVDCPTYNVGSDEAIRLDELAKWMAEEYSLGVDLPEISLDKDMDRYVPAIRSAQRDLSLRLRFPLRDAVRETIRILQARR